MGTKDNQIGILLIPVQPLVAQMHRSELPPSIPLHILCTRFEKTGDCSQPGGIDSKAHFTERERLWLLLSLRRHRPAISIELIRFFREATGISIFQAAPSMVLVME